MEAVFTLKRTLEYALRRNDIFLPSIRAKKKVNVYSDSSLNMPTNERKITKLLPLPMLHTVRLSQFMGTNAYFAKGKAQGGAYQLWRQQIFEAAPSHHNVRLQVAGECDLISAGAKYYLACLHSFQSSTEKTRSPARSETDLHLSGCAMRWCMQRRKVKLLTCNVPGKGILL